MKICNGFVTNSSSTSYVISSAKGLTRDSFLTAMGVSDESLLIDVFNDLYKAIHSSVELVPQGVNIREYLISRIEFINETDLLEIEKRYIAGEKVYWGELADSGDYGGVTEAFYSHESVVVINDDIYFNAKSSVY